jgi:hypothetical protein
MNTNEMRKKLDDGVYPALETFIQDRSIYTRPLVSPLELIMITGRLPATDNECDDYSYLVSWQPSHRDRRSKS